MGLPPKIIQIIDHFGVETHGFEATHGETSIMSHGFPSFFPPFSPRLGQKTVSSRGYGGDRGVAQAGCATNVAPGSGKIHIFFWMYIRSNGICHHISILQVV